MTLVAALAVISTQNSTVNGLSSICQGMAKMNMNIASGNMQKLLGAILNAINRGEQPEQDTRTSDSPATGRRKHIFSSNNWVWKGPKTQSSPQQSNATAPTDLQTTEDKNADSNEGGNDERP